MNSTSRSMRGAKISAALFIVIAAAVNTSCSNRSNVDAPTLPRQPLTGQSVIAPGVTVGGIAVGGLSLDTAKATVAAQLVKASSTIVFRLRNEETGDYYHYKLKQFGGTFDIGGAILAAAAASPGVQVPINLKVDPDQVNLHIQRLAAIWDTPVQEPRVAFSSDDTRTISNGHSGRTLDIDSSAKLVLGNLPSIQNPTETVNLPFIDSYPQVQPASVVGLDDILTSYTTTFNPGNATRTNNLLLAVKNINGTVVGPNEVFSYNDSVGPRTQETGFQDAIIYVDNRMKKDVGGGICQASSTLYNAVLLANLPIVERHAHSLPVHYVPAGRDATVAWGGDDFRFRNNTSKPIIVRAVATPGGTLTEYLIGDRNAVPNPGVQIAIDVTPKVTEPDGFKVYSYRVVKENGVLIAKEPLGASYYHNLVGGVPH